jgi:hypothetical protein
VKSKGDCFGLRKEGVELEQNFLAKIIIFYMIYKISDFRNLNKFKVI